MGEDGDSAPRRCLVTDQPQPGQPPTPSASPAAQGSGTLWKALSAVFAVAAVGFAAWAFTLNADAQETEQAGAEQLVALEAEHQQLAEQVAALESEKAALQQANDALGSATGDLAVAQAERDQARALAEVSQVCAAGALSALTILGDSGDADAAPVEITKVAPACEAAFDETSQPG